MFRRTWESAEGAVVDRRAKRQGATGSDASLERWLVEVTPPSGEPFRVELGIPGWGSNFKAPMIGQTVKVLCNPAHTKARFDTSDPQLSYKFEQRTKKQQWDKEIGPQGTDPG